MRLIKQDKVNLVEIEPNKLSCLCGNDEFTTHGNSFAGISVISCRKCNRKTAINKIGNYRVEKLLSACGEDYCNVIGNIYRNKHIIKELKYTEFGTTLKVKKY